MLTSLAIGPLTATDETTAQVDGPESQDKKIYIRRTEIKRLTNQDDGKRKLNVKFTYQKTDEENETENDR